MTPEEALNQIEQAGDGEEIICSDPSLPGYTTAQGWQSPSLNLSVLSVWLYYPLPRGGFATNIKAEPIIGAYQESWHPVSMHMDPNGDNK